MRIKYSEPDWCEITRVWNADHEYTGMTEGQLYPYSPGDCCYGHFEDREEDEYSDSLNAPDPDSFFVAFYFGGWRYMPDKQIKDFGLGSGKDNDVILMGNYYSAAGVFHTKEKFEEISKGIEVPDAGIF